MDRVVRILREYAEDIENEVRDEHAAGRSERQTDYFKRHTFIRDEEDRRRRFEAKEEEDLQALLNRCGLVLEAKMRRFEDERKGPAEEVLSDIDLPAQVRSLEFSALRPRSRYSSQVAIFVSFDGDGAQALVRSHSEDWPRAVLGRLGDALRPNRPWYSFLGKAWTWLCALLLVNALAITLVSFGPSWGYRPPGAVVFVVLAFQAVITVLSFFWRRFFPRFEYRASTKSPVGVRALALLGSSVLYVGSLAIPLLISPQ